MTTARPLARHMPKAAYLYLVLVLPLLLGFALGQPGLADQASAEETVPASMPKPALWRLSDEDSEIWLFGTVHILNPALKWRTAKVDAAFKDAGIYYSEAPVVQADTKMMQPLIMKHGINRSNVPFTNKLSKQGKADFKATLKALGMPEDTMKQFEAYRPWLAGVSIGALQVQARGGDPEAGVDKILWREAVADGKMLGYFETMEQQVSLFGAMTPEEELKFFEDGLRQMIEEPDLLDEITLDWQAGRIDALSHKLNGAMEGQESLRDRLLVDRNRAWAMKIKELMDGEGTIFVAVGAGHLAGDGSVQDHLEQLGYTVTRAQ
ncbi:TraB/GumN family protein [Kordiimonas aestuarii]|uniref:TraB/GumN family protein n=1 Tax=Kordiimonas aestuarii TaxID=1005925 RepID=UPI0021D0BDAE|nr:TraB/GumN family protein [Kordiimonas aestuarii]